MDQNPKAEESTTARPQAKNPLVRSLAFTKQGLPVKTILLIGGIILAGGLTGLLLNRFTGTGGGSLKSSTEAQEQGIAVGDVVGVQDEGTFRDKAVGVLEKGGVDGEGSHRLLREGGPNQTAYLTSSVVDLDLFVGHKIEVWGETFAGQKAGWLMDVGRVKVVELNAPKPFEEETEE